MIKKIINRLKSTAESEGILGLIKVLSEYLLLYIFKPFNFCLLSLFRLLPIKNRYMVMESEGDYSDNVRTFYEYMLANGYNKYYKIIWFVHNPKEYKRARNVIFVSRFHKTLNIKANYYAGVSKYFLFTHPYWLKNWRKEQIVIYVNHGVAPLKLQLPPKDYKIFDIMLGCSPYGQQILGRGYAVSPDTVLTIGMPRMDLLYAHKDCCRMLFDDYQGQKLILSMQTFKQSAKWSDSTAKDPYALNIINSKEELKELDEFLGQNNLLLAIKIHHLQNMSYIQGVNLKNIRYLTDDNLKACDIQTNELLENASVLLTDYSSVFYEFLLKDRPIGFLIGDIDSYSRGFMVEDPLSEMPGEKITSLNQLKSFITDAVSGNDSYADERKSIRNRMFSHQDAGNCKRLMSWIRHH